MTFIIQKILQLSVLYFMKPFFYFIILLCLPAGVKAQSPHGGQLKIVEAYRMEAVNCAGYLEIYLYTLDRQPVRNRGFSGHVDFHYPDSSCATAPLYLYSNDSFTAEAKDGSYVSCDVFIFSRGLSLHAKFADLVCRLPDDEDQLNR